MLVRFFLLAYGISWLFWLPAAISPADPVGPFSARTLHLLGGLGPMAAALFVARKDGPARFARLVRGTTMAPGWMAIGVAIPAALFAVSVVIAGLMPDHAIDAARIGESAEFPDLPRPLYWLLTVVCYGYGEETGWRGFALPRLQTTRSALSASLMLAAMWAGWHLPLFFFSPGLATMGWGAVAGWFSSLCLGSILLTWLFNSSGGSIGAVALFHASLDVFITSPVVPNLDSVMGTLLTLGAVALVPLYGPKDLSRRPRVTV